MAAQRTLTRARTAPRSVGQVLLTRRGHVHLPVGSTPAGSTPAGASTPGVDLLEADLLAHGFLLSAAARAALASLEPVALVAVGSRLLADTAAAVGDDCDHTPLFRGFPDSTPADTTALHADRVLALLLQEPTQPCVLCGAADTVLPVSPCGHLVCRACWDARTYAACPICGRMLSAGDPFLKPSSGRLVRTLRARLGIGSERSDVAPRRMRVLQLGGDDAGDLDAAALAEVLALLARSGALSPADTDDLRDLLATRSRTDLGWLPERIAGRVGKAHLVAWLLSAPTTPAAHEAALGLLDTATDVLRVLCALSGTDAGLVTVGRLRTVPRPVRRTLLQSLDALGVAAVEDVRRHERLWKSAAQQLRPFEHAARFPQAARTFAVLRGTDVAGATGPLAAALSSTGDSSGTGRLKHTSLTGQVEVALAARDVPAAVALLAARPGELLRRADHLLRLAALDPGAASQVADAVAAACPRVSPQVLLGTLAALQRRTRPQDLRVFFPRAGTARVHVVADDRPPLPVAVVEPVTAAILGELAVRAGVLPPVGVALVDQGLDAVMVPAGERTASRALVTLPRGSALPVPLSGTATLRAFLHWTEPDDVRVDLDLSAVLLDEQFAHVGTCDFTQLRFAGTGAVHSGDHTSAPAPHGASEFLDLDVARLLAEGVRHVVLTVLAFNDVPFGDLPEAFAGVMHLEAGSTTATPFDARAVEQRFDLGGASKRSVPLLLDLQTLTLRWLDVTAGVTGGLASTHAVHHYVGDYELLARALDGLYGGGGRPTLGTVARLLAAGRARTVLVRDGGGQVRGYARADGETVQVFADRLGAAGPADLPVDAGLLPELAFLVRGDVALAPGASAYAVHPHALGPDVTLLAASDLVAALDVPGS